MNHEARIRLLSAHADHLNEGEEWARRFLQRQHALAPELVELMSLAQRVKLALTPIVVPEAFRRQLYDDLLAHSELTRFQSDESNRRTLWVSLAALGSVLPLVGIVAWRRRRRTDTHTLVGTG